MEYAPGRVVADLRIARGLDYYTGTVYETALVGYESWGAVCSGGRYDALASDGRTTYPGVGISIGVSRILGLLLGKGLVRASRSTPAAVLVAVTSEESRARSVAVAGSLRSRGIPCEVAPRADKFGKQIRYAERRGIPYVWFPGRPGRPTATRSRTSAPATRSRPTRRRGSARRRTSTRPSNASADVSPAARTISTQHPRSCADVVGRSAAIDRSDRRNCADVAALWTGWGQAPSGSGEAGHPAGRLAAVERHAARASSNAASW